MIDLMHTNSMIQEIKELLSGARQQAAIQVNTELLSKGKTNKETVLKLSRKGKEK